MLASGRGVCWRPNREASMARGAASELQDTAVEHCVGSISNLGMAQRCSRSLDAGGWRTMSREASERARRGRGGAAIQRCYSRTIQMHARQECGPWPPWTAGSVDGSELRCSLWPSPSRLEQVMNVAVRAANARATMKGCWLGAGCWVLGDTAYSHSITKFWRASLG
jgi:hypothetical protein